LQFNLRNLSCSVVRSIGTDELCTYPSLSLLLSPYLL
jgi:hypothetical protein